jgi:hypothetical protein
VSTVAEFSKGSFLENLVVRADGSVLNKNQLWYVPASTNGAEVQPVLMHTFDHPTMGIVEASADVYYVATSEIYTTHDSYVVRVDLRNWQLGMPVPVTTLGKVDGAVALNGMTMPAPNVILLADSGAGQIWRVDVAPDGSASPARVWLKDEDMIDGSVHLPPPAQPGVNGLRYGAKTGYLYYTSTSRQLFMRVKVDPTTSDPVGPPELVGQGWMADDFVLDEDVGVAYVTTHRQNTIERVPLNPGDQDERTVGGKPFDPLFAGPSSACGDPARPTSGPSRT